MLIFRFTFLCSIICLSPGQISVSTIPETSGIKVYVAAVEGEHNVTLLCFVYNGDTHVTTAWFIQRNSIESFVVPIDFFSNGTISNPNDLADDIFVTGDNVPNTNVTFLSNFTILNFTSQFDGATIQCGTTTNRETFNLGFPGLSLI